MTKRVLILGANGRIGRAAIEAFSAAGWSISALVRRVPASAAPTIQWHEADAFDADAVAGAAEGADVILNGLNPPYERWANDLPRLTASVLTAARRHRSTVIIPGNVYNYGDSMPAVLTETTPHRPSTVKGRLREQMEAAYRQAGDDGVQTIIVRAGDFIERAQTGNWFDTYITNDIRRGIVTYPGPTDVPHAWAYLPDLARAMVGLAEQRHSLGRFETFGFAGHTFTGEQLRQQAEAVLGRPVKIKSFPWPLLRFLGLFRRSIHAVLEMRYLWNVPHQIDGHRLNERLPELRTTPLPAVLRTVWALEGPEDAAGAASSLEHANVSR